MIRHPMNTREHSTRVDTREKPDKAAPAPTAKKGRDRTPTKEHHPS